MKTSIYRRLICLLLVVLLAAAALTLTGCKERSKTEDKKTETTSSTETASSEEKDDARKQLGEGDTVFYFDVTFSDGSTSSYEIHTDRDTVGDALTDTKLVEGEVGDYGLYVTTVDGETLDWDADNMYWAFYENGEYAMTGVDTTEITDGATYSFVATKG